MPDVSSADEDFIAGQNSIDEREAALQALLGELDEQMAAVYHRSTQINRWLGAQVALVVRTSRVVDASGKHPADPAVFDQDADVLVRRAGPLREPGGRAGQEQLSDQAAQ